GSSCADQGWDEARKLQMLWTQVGKRPGLTPPEVRNDQQKQQRPICVETESHNQLDVLRLCTRNVSRALIERPFYSREPQAVGAVYDRPGSFVQSYAELHPHNVILR